MLPDPVSDLPTHALPWLESFDVGDHRIDGEHRALIDGANELCALALRQPDETVLRDAARGLIAFAEDHFASEETMFPTIGYAERQSHVREHRTISAAMKNLLLDGPAVAAAAVTARLLLLEHILRHDLGFKTWIQVANGR